MQSSRGLCLHVPTRAVLDTSDSVTTVASVCVGCVSWNVRRATGRFVRSVFPVLTTVDHGRRRRIRHVHNWRRVTNTTVMMETLSMTKCEASRECERDKRFYKMRVRSIDLTCVVVAVIRTVRTWRNEIHKDGEATQEGQGHDSHWFHCVCLPALLIVVHARFITGFICRTYAYVICELRITYAHVMARVRVSGNS